MNAPANRTVIVRETLVSMAINAVLSIGFFVAMFGLRAPVPAGALGRDFLPQAFMVALMGSLVPGLLVRRGSGLPARPVVMRAVVLAVAAAIVAGGGAWLVCRQSAVQAIAPGAALSIKAAFGAVLAAIVTPIAVRAALPAAVRAAP